MCVLFCFYLILGELSSGIRCVPFRLTHSIQDFVTKIGIQGPLTATMISAATSLTHPNYKVRSILCAILRDEFITWFRRIKSSEKANLLSAMILQAQNRALEQSADPNKSSTSPATKPSLQMSPELQAVFSKDIPQITSEHLVNLVNKSASSIMSRLTSKFTTNLFNVFLTLTLYFVFRSF